MRPTFSWLALLAVSNANPTPPAELNERQLDLLQNAQLDFLQYAPRETTCPGTPLVRSANGISQDEQAYVSARKPKADAALASWLARQGNFSSSAQPTLALVSSGGGLRALLETAGVVQALDERDSTSGTSGLYQALTYHTSLSGGAWFLGSQSGNNWPTVSYLRDTLWKESFDYTLLVPANLFSERGVRQYPEIIGNLVAKEGAGFDTTIIDLWGRLLSYQFLQAEDGGVAVRLSDLATYSNFTEHNVPFPIMTALGVNGEAGACYPSVDALQYEFSPFEYGSWDAGVSAFARSKYMGTTITNGQTGKTCIERYDNLGYVYGTSSNVFPTACQGLNSSTQGFLQDLLTNVHQPRFNDLFGLYVNPFYQSSQSAAVASQKQLTLVDGGIANQNNPIWPMIQPSRSADVLLVNDNSFDTEDYYPNGTQILQTYINAQKAGLTKMPFIPDVNTFVTQGLNKRATFFGCTEPNTTLIIYLPNALYTFPSQPTLKLQYSEAETTAMIDNGNHIATQNNDPAWPFCFACGIKARDDPALLPANCTECYDKYCYKQ